MVDYLNNRVVKISTLLIDNPDLLPAAFHNIDVNKSLIKLMNNIKYFDHSDFDIVVQDDYKKFGKNFTRKTTNIIKFEGT